MANTISMGTQAGNSGGWELAGAVSLSSSQTNLLNGVDITPYKQIEILGSNISTNTTDQVQFNFAASVSKFYVYTAAQLITDARWGLFSHNNRTITFNSSFSFLTTLKMTLYNSILHNKYYHPFEIFCGGSQSAEVNYCIANLFFNTTAITGNTTLFEEIKSISISQISNTSTAYVYGLR